MPLRGLFGRRFTSPPPLLFSLLVLLTVWLSAGCSSAGQTPAQPAAVAPSATPVATAMPGATGTGTAVPATLTPPPTAEPNQPAPICSSPVSRPPFESAPPVIDFEIVNEYPHDPDAFTQGLIFVDGIMYESTGTKVTSSSLRRVELETGAVQQIITLPEPNFGEGLALWGDRLIQLTWQQQVAFVYDRGTFELRDQFEYEGEGWGLTENGRCLIMSNGSDIITFRDPETFAILGELPVYSDRGPVTLLNELEYIDGHIYANIWFSDLIARISPATGQVTAWIDLGELNHFPNRQVDVLNGIAYDADNDRLFVTGKLWPILFEIKLIPPS